MTPYQDDDLHELDMAIGHTECGCDSCEALKSLRDRIEGLRKVIAALEKLVNESAILLRGRG